MEGTMWIPCLPRASASGQLVSRARMLHAKRPIHQEFHPIACSQMCRVEPCFGYAERTGSWLTCGIEVFVSPGHATASSSCYCNLLLATPPNGWKLTSSEWPRVSYNFLCKYEPKRFLYFKLCVKAWGFTPTPTLGANF